MTDDAERTVNLRPDASASGEGALVAPNRAEETLVGAPGAAHVYGKPARSQRTVGRDLASAGFLAVVLTVLGLPAAMLWQIVSPRVEFVVLDGGWASVESYPSGYVEGDLVFAAIGLGLGIFAAVLAWTAMRGSRGPIQLLGLVIGSVGCQVVAWKIGAKEWQHFWDSVENAPAGAHMWRPPSVLFTELDPAAAWAALKVGNFTTALDALQLGALAVMALAATFTYTVCAGWSRRPSLRTDAPE